MSVVNKITRKKRPATRDSLTRGTHPGRARKGAGRFTRDKQPKGRGRPKGAQNVFTREIKEAIIAAANIVGEDDEGKDGLTGYMVRLARGNETVFGGLLRAIIPTQMVIERVEKPQSYKSFDEVKKELARYGIDLVRPLLPNYRGPEIELDAIDVTDNGGAADKDHGA
jgi:hypothetical protein